MIKYNFIQLQTVQLQKELDELRKEVSGDTVERALREVKEYASRSNDLNIDTLQMKLMHLDEVARRIQHPERELYSLVLLRFLNHKDKRNIGFLITSLLSTQAESRIFEKEQKFLKLYATETAPPQPQKEAVTKPSPKADSEDNYAMMYNFMQMVNSFRHPAPAPRLPNFPVPRRGGFAGPRPRPPYQYSGCYKCGDMSHLRIDCPKK